MWSYILKRLLLMIPTLLGVLTLTFVVIQFVPGGPVEQVVHELRHGAASSGAAVRHAHAHGRRSRSRSRNSRALYGFDKPPLERYVADAQALRDASISATAISAIKACGR